MLYRTAMVILLRIAGKILLFLPRGIKKNPPFLYQCGTSASALSLAHISLHLLYHVWPYATFLLQHAACNHYSWTALQFMPAIGKSTTHYTLPYVYRVTWTVYTRLQCNYWACDLLMVVTTIYAQLIVLSAWCHAVSVTSCCPIGHISRMVTHTCPCTDINTKTAALEGLLSCCIDDALSYLNHSMPLVIPILKIFFRLCTELKSTKHATISWWNYGGTPPCTSTG